MLLYRPQNSSTESKATTDLTCRTASCLPGRTRRTSTVASGPSRSRDSNSGEHLDFSIDDSNVGGSAHSVQPHLVNHALGLVSRDLDGPLATVLVRRVLPGRSTYVAVVNAKVQMLAAIGETFETPLPKDGQDAPVPAKSDLVTGVIVSARPGL
jgi:hypothetical protein